MSFRTKQAIDFWLGNTLLLLLFLPVRGLGLLLRRRHTLDQRRGCVVIKLVGAGSLFQATPALQAIRAQFPPGRFHLIGTRGVTGFAEPFGWFDACWTIDDRSLWRLATSSIRAIVLAGWRCDHLIDLEVHSRLTTVFSCLTLVRNRIGFVDEIARWRPGFYTHMTFFSAQGPVYAFYDLLAAWFGVGTVAVGPVHAAFAERARATALPLGLLLPPRYVAIGPGCSDFGAARQMHPAEWQQLLSACPDPVVILGAPSDAILCAAIAQAIPGSIDLAGRLGIAQSSAVLAGAARFVGIDSLLLHLARALEVPCDSIWGPTDPATRLRARTTDDRIYFSKMPCAPCIHVHESPPCGGARTCIPAALRLAPKPLGVAARIATGWAMGPHDRTAFAVSMEADPMANDTVEMGAD